MDAIIKAAHHRLVPALHSAAEQSVQWPSWSLTGVFFGTLHSWNSFHQVLSQWLEVGDEMSPVDTSSLLRSSRHCYFHVIVIYVRSTSNSSVFHVERGDRTVVPSPKLSPSRTSVDVGRRDE